MTYKVDSRKLAQPEQCWKCQNKPAFMEFWYEYAPYFVPQCVFCHAKVLHLTACNRTSTLILQTSFWEQPFQKPVVTPIWK